MSQFEKGIGGGNMKKVSELEGAELDYWVARAEGYSDEQITCRQREQPWTLRYLDWALGGPIIERERIELQCGDAIGDGHTWFAHPAAIVDPNQPSQVGPTPLIAAMRCYVASKFGETVPEEK